MIHFRRHKPARLSEDQMIRYLENTIQGEEKAELEHILAHCASCRKELEHVRRWLPYRTLAQRQIPASAPTPEFSARLLESVRHETEQASQQAVRTRTLLPRPVQLRRFGLAAATLVVLAGLWSLYTLANQPARSTASLPETTAAAMLDQSVDMAVPEAAGAPDVTAAGGSGSGKGLFEPQPETESAPVAEARLFTAAVHSWYAIREDFVLPVDRQSAPGVPVLAGEILAGASSAIWIEPNRLITAWPVAAGKNTAEVVADAMADLTPAVSLTAASADEAERLLTDWLATEATAAWQALQQPDCQYLILEFGGT